MASEKSVNNYTTNDTGASSEYDDYSNLDPTTYFKNMNLRYFAAEPVEMVTKHAKLKEMCLKKHNPEAHYIEGILRYFVHKEKSTGLFHLRQSAIGNNINSIYLYGLLKLALGKYPKGKKYLDKLQWKENLSTSDQCWERVKNSLSSVPTFMEQEYYINMVNLKPRTKCHPENGTEVCENCYYYKRLDQFIEFAMNRE